MSFQWRCSTLLYTSQKRDAKDGVRPTMVRWDMSPIRLARKMAFPCCLSSVRSSVTEDGAVTIPCIICLLLAANCTTWNIWPSREKIHVVVSLNPSAGIFLKTSAHSPTTCRLRK